MWATLAKIGAVTVGIAGILALVVNLLQFQQAEQVSTEQDAAQATLIKILEEQLALQRQLATLEAEQSNTGPTDSAFALRATEIEATARHLATLQSQAEATIAPTPSPVTVESSHTPSPKPALAPPQLVEPLYGEYRSPITFSWLGGSNQSFQVTLRHIDKGFTHASEWIRGFSWTFDIPGSEYGNWEWYVTDSNGRTSNAEKFVFDPFPGPTGRRYPTGDLNRDCVVNESDRDIWNAALLSQPGDANWNPDADLNGDDLVDLTDYGILSAHWGETCN